MQPLNHLAAVSFTGVDAKAFCESQFTAHLGDGPDPYWRPAAWCSPSGKVICTLLYRVSADGVTCITLSVVLSTVIDQLRPFMIGRAVEVGPIGPVFGASNSGRVGNLVYDLTRTLSLDADEAHDGAPMLREMQWQEQDILFGMPWVPPGLTQQFLPQSLGLQRLGGLSYQKGCYPGQEVIAKIHYRGEVKQTVVIITPESPEKLESGMALYLNHHNSEVALRGAVAWVLAVGSHHALCVCSKRLESPTSLFTDSGEIKLTDWTRME